MYKQREYLLVDGYNILFSWDMLREIAAESLEDARKKLIDILCDYQGITGQEIYLVFDAHLVRGNMGKDEKHGLLRVVYTKEDETADNFIERTVYELPKRAKIRVATSDNLEQILILANGATRVSAREFYIEVNSVRERARTEFIERKPVKRNTLIDNLDPKTAEFLERMRRGK